MMKLNLRMVLALMLLLAGFLPGSGFALAGEGGADVKKVLVVMSYHPDYEGEVEIARGLEAEMSGVEFRYFYLNAKYDYEGAGRLGEEAYRIFREYLPDAVVAVDDPAQLFFVVPYLRDRVEVPVIFCGVNFEAGKYSFPASNVTGVLEKKHYRESLSFARLVAPKLNRVALIYKDNPTNRQNLAQVESEEGDYPVAITGKYPVANLAELKELLAHLEKQVDGIMLLNLSGIVDDSGVVMDGTDVLRLLSEVCTLPTIGASSWEIRSGILCGVIKSNEEQGTISAAMLKKIWDGTPVSDLPIMQNRNGLRLVNVTTLKRLGLSLSPEAVLGTRLMVTGQD